VLKHHVLPQIETIIDEEKKQSHKKIATFVKNIFEDPSRIAKKVSSNSLVFVLFS